MNKNSNLKKTFWLKPIFFSHHKEWPKGQSYTYIVDIKRFDEQSSLHERGMRQTRDIWPTAAKRRGMPRLYWRRADIEMIGMAHHSAPKPLVYTVPIAIGNR